MSNETPDSTTDTLIHIQKVQTLLLGAITEIAKRAAVHDASKLLSPEKEGFDQLRIRLADCVYGSAEYSAALAESRPTIAAHYLNNTHHPEHYPNGVNDMDLFDILEMFFDWKAASERTWHGDIYASLVVNRGRFNLSDQLYSIMLNTARRMGWPSPILAPKPDTASPE